jgi:ABC-2 type transport system permease protein
MNPMIRKELRQRMRERKGWILPSLYLLVLGAVIALSYYLRTANVQRELQGWEIGVALFFTAAYAQLALLLLLAPTLSAGALTIEKEQATLGGLLTSLLTSAQIWWGKFVASMLFVLLLLVAGLPILSVVFAFGGVGLWEVWMATVTTIVILGTTSAIGLYWSSAFRRSVYATAVSYVTVIAMSLVTFVIFLVLASAYHAPSDTWNNMPILVKAPLYLNPFFFLTVAFAAKDQLYPEWVTCLLVFMLIAAFCVTLTVRNLRRSGEMG